MREASLAGIACVAARRAQGTPVGPIGAALAEALIRAGRGGVDGQAGLRLRAGNGRGAVRIGDLSLASRSGARLAATGGAAIVYHWPERRAQLDGEFALSGGGFPEARFQLGAGPERRRCAGRGRIAPMAAGGAGSRSARSASPPRRAAGPASATSVLVDGPFGGGRVDRPDAAAAAAASARRVRARRELRRRRASARFRSRGCGSARPACRSARSAAPSSGRRAAARSGRAPSCARRASPAGSASRRSRSPRAGCGSTSTVSPPRGLAVRLGAAGAVNRLDMAACQRPLRAGRRRRRLSRAFGQARQRRRCWSARARAAGRCAAATLAVEGRIRVTDERDPVRFHPLVSDDFRLTLADNRIHATGWLNHPQSGTRVASATIDHRSRAPARARPCSTSRGSPSTERLPARGAHAAHHRRGRAGRRHGHAARAGSTGTRAARAAPAPSRPTDMDLAAPFGPVEGLTTTIHFTDLLGLTSAPGQEARDRPRPRRHRRL